MVTQDYEWLVSLAARGMSERDNHPMPASVTTPEGFYLAMARSALDAIGLRVLLERPTQLQHELVEARAAAQLDKERLEAKVSELDQALLEVRAASQLEKERLETREFQIDEELQEVRAAARLEVLETQAAAQLDKERLEAKVSELDQALLEARAAGKHIQKKLGRPERQSTRQSRTESSMTTEKELRPTQRPARQLVRTEPPTMTRDKTAKRGRGRKRRKHASS